MEDPALREMAEYVEANRDEIWEKLPGNRQVTLLVFREGDQLNFFRVVDRGDGTLTPLSESLRFHYYLKFSTVKNTEFCIHVSYVTCSVCFVILLLSFTAEGI